MHKKVRIWNSIYKTTKFDFHVVKNLIIAVLFSLLSIYFIYLTLKLGFSGVYAAIGGWGIALTICTICLAIIFWITTFQTFNSVNLYNIMTNVGKIRIKYLEFYNDGIAVYEDSSNFKIEYKDIKSVDFHINASVISGKYYLNNLKLNIVFNSGEELKDISITQDPSFNIIDQIYDILYFSQRCPNFSLKFSGEKDFLQTTLGKAISSYLNNNYHHTFRSFMQTSKGVFLFFVGIMFLMLVIFWSHFI